MSKDTMHYKEIGERYIYCNTGGFNCQSTSDLEQVDCGMCIKRLKSNGIIK